MTGELDRREIRFPDDRGDQGRDQILDQRSDDGTKRHAHHDRAGEVENVAAKYELLESLQHFASCEQSLETPPLASAKEILPVNEFYKGLIFVMVTVAIV